MDAPSASDPAFRRSRTRYPPPPLSFELDPKGAAKPLELRLSVFGEKDGAFDVVVNGVRVGETEIKRHRPLSSPPA